MADKSYGFFADYKCPICNKNFIKAAEHIYKVGDKYLCSWTCYRQARAKIRQYRTVR